MPSDILCFIELLTLKVPDKLQLYGLYVYYVVHICDFGMLRVKGDLRTICRFSYIKVYKLITLGTKFKTLLSLGRKITMFFKIHNKLH